MLSIVTLYCQVIIIVMHCIEVHNGLKYLQVHKTSSSRDINHPQTLCLES